MWRSRCDEHDDRVGKEASVSESGLLERYELSQEDFREISSRVMRLCGINLHNGKRELVKARLSKRLRLLGIETYREYMKYVEHDASGAELANMIDALSTNVTHFFREVQHLDYLRENLLPRLADSRRRDRQRRLRIWSAGCSSGEEPYSIGITLLESLPDAEQWDIKILATDISNTVLAKARRGVYEEAKLKDVPAALRSKYFELEDAGPPRTFGVCRRLRQMVHFAHLNLMEPWPMKGPFDFIFCRNVMIYFDKSTQQSLIERFSQLLGTGGVLFIGHSESLSGVKHKLSQLHPTVYSN